MINGKLALAKALARKKGQRLWVPPKEKAK